MAKYKIKKGDTLSKISRNLGVSVKDLATANKIKDINKIQAGSNLIIPSKKPTTLIEKKVPEQNKKVTKKKVSKKKDNKKEDVKKYTIKKGDNLSKIAGGSLLTLAQLLEANPKLQKNPDQINADQIINIPQFGIEDQKAFNQRINLPAQVPTADTILPSNLRQLFSDMNPFGSDKDFTEANLDKDEYAAAQELVRRIQAQGRSNISYDDFNTTGGDGYSDVGGGGAFGLQAAYDKFKDPMYSLKTLIGQGNITTNDAGETIITDRYNFNEPNPESLGDYRKKAALVASNPLYQGPRQLGSIFGSDEGEGSFVRLNLGNLNPETSAQGGLTRHFKNGGNTNMNIEQQTKNVAAQGRYGDSMLMHVNPIEVAGLSQVMPLTVNPDTGQPEAFLPLLAPLLGSLAGGSLLGGTLGAGLASAVGSGLATYAVTGSGKKGLLSALTGYGLGKALGGASDILGKGTEAAGSQALTNVPRALHAPPSMSVNPTTAVASNAFNPIQSIKDISGSGMEGLRALGASASRAGTYMPMYAGLAGQGMIESQEDFVNQMAQLQSQDSEEYNRILAEHPEYVPMLRSNTTYASGGGRIGYATGGNARAVAGVETRPIDPFFMAGFQPETAYLKNLNPSSGQIISGQSGYDYGTEIENRPMSGPFDPTQTTGYQNFYNAPAASYVLDPYKPVDLGSLPERREPINEMPQPTFPAPVDNPNRIGPQPMPPIDFNPVAPANAVTPSEDITNPTASMYGSSPETTSGLGFNTSMPINNIGADLPSIMPSYGNVGNFAGIQAGGGSGSYSMSPAEMAEVNASTMEGATPEFSTADMKLAATLASGNTGTMSANAQVAADVLNARAAAGDTETKTLLANMKRNAKASQTAADNAADTAGYQRDKASAMNTLYGGAGSSFESGRNEYTESGQYDIDREARQAEFDAMRAGGPKLTQAETQQAVKDMQERIGFGGVMSMQGGGDAYELGLAARAKAAADEERGFVDYGEPVFAAPNAQPVSDVIEPPQRQTRPIGKGRERGGRARRAAGGSTNFPDLTGDGEVTQADILKGRGVKGFQAGGLTEELISDPVTQETIKFITGESPTQEIVNEFLQKYGNEAFIQLREAVLQQIAPNAQTEGLISGNGNGGMTDDISGTIGNRQDIAVSQDEFIVPADVVSQIGDGSSNSGAKELYAMMDRVRKEKTGTTQQAPRLASAGGYLPA